jgi:hypothetical protein
MNWIVILIAAFIPLIVGFIWFHPAVFGKAWMRAADMTEEKIKTGNMPLIFGLSFILAAILGLTYPLMQDHWMAYQSFFRPIAEHGMGVDPATPFGTELKGLIDGYGERYHSWTHGLAHSLGISLMVLLPVMGTNTMFERKSFKYFLVNWTYWGITIALMYSVIAEFS